MANQKNIEAKAAKALAVQEKIQGASSVVVTDYRGYTVAEDTELRNQMRAAGVEYVVLRNIIVERAAKDAALPEEFIGLLKGPSAFAFGPEDDAVAPARILKGFIKSTKKGALKGGLMEGRFADAAEMNKIADLPSREVLIAKILGSINSPIAKLAIALNQIKEKAESGVDLSALSADKPEETTEATPEAVAAPVEEAPAAEAAPVEEAAAPAPAEEAAPAEAPAEESPATE